MIPTALPTPPRQPMKQCTNKVNDRTCGAMNEPSRTSCRNCGASL